MAPFEQARIKRLANSLIEVAYPPQCAGCGLRGRWVCDECLSSTPLFAEPRCATCSMPSIGAPCDCRALPDRIDRLWVAGPYEGWLKAAVYSFKFSGETARAPQLAGLLADTCAAFGPIVALAPVPLHPKRRRQRGYDQTLLLANRIALETGQPIYTGLHKVRNTPHQVGLTAAERSLNLLDAFALQSGSVVPEHVILIDDVATTGATLTECAIALRKGGARSVSAVVIAHGL